MKIEITKHEENSLYPQENDISNPNVITIGIDEYHFIFSKAEHDQLKKDLKENVIELFSFSKWVNVKQNNRIKLLEYASDRLQFLIDNPTKRGYLRGIEMENVFLEYFSGTFKSVKEFFEDKDEEPILSNKEFLDNYVKKDFIPDSLKPYMSDKKSEKKNYELLNVYNKSIFVGLAIPEPIHNNKFTLKFYDSKAMFDIQNGLQLIHMIVPEMVEPYQDLQKAYAKVKDYYDYSRKTLSSLIFEDSDNDYIDFDINKKTIPELVTMRNAVEKVLAYKPQEELFNTIQDQTKNKAKLKP